MIFCHGISRTGEILDYAVELGLVKKSGAWFSYNDMRIGQGRENAKKWIGENPDITTELEDKIMANAQKLAYNADDDEEDAPAEASTEASASEAPAPEEQSAKKSKAKKSSVVVAADDDFEEFSIDEISE